MKPGDIVLVRSTADGVVVGELVERDGQRVSLKNAHRIWRWRGANTLFELSKYGPDLDSFTRISERVDEHEILEACSITLCSPKAATNLRKEVWND